jgi:hypothetical protein
MQDPEEIWNLLHDGSIERVAGSVPGDLTLQVSIEYLTDRMAPPCDGLIVILRGVAYCQALLWSDDRTSSDPQVLEDLEILSGDETPEGVRLFVSGATVDLRYEDVVVAGSDGRPLSVGDIEALATAYWDAFAARPRL